jgi:hypothetical protein
MMIPGYEIIDEISRDDLHVIHRGRRGEDRRAVLLEG